MGISASGERTLRAKTLPTILLSILVIFSTFYFFLGPAMTPGVRQAAEDKCNKLNGANYRSYRLEWKMPSNPSWDVPHFLCSDAREPGKPGVSFGWWVNPF